MVISSCLSTIHPFHVPHRQGPDIDKTPYGWTAYCWQGDTPLAIPRSNDIKHGLSNFRGSDLSCMHEPAETGCLHATCTKCGKIKTKDSLSGNAATLVNVFVDSFLRYETFTIMAALWPS